MATVQRQSSPNMPAWHLNRGYQLLRRISFGQAKVMCTLACCPHGCC